MPEEQLKTGNSWTKNAVILLEGLGWKQKGDINTDIKCVIHNKRPHGIDAFLTYYDPYQSKDIGIIVEAKNYAMRNINLNFIQGVLDSMIEKLECAPLSDDFPKKFQINNVFINTGLILIWSHEGYDKQKFLDILSQLKIKNKRNTLRIMILDNQDILKLYNILNLIKEINQSLKENEKFEIYYPSYSKSDSYNKNNFISIEYFKSKYIFGKMIKIESISKSTSSTVNYGIIFYFDNLDYDNLNFMYLGLRRFQLTEEKIIIYHYEDKPYEKSSSISQFKREHTNENIEFKPINKISTVPWVIDSNV